jgi:predicted RNA-binding Zn-ribbon protein involved in translation (DUF1610 family)
MLNERVRECPNCKFSHEEHFRLGGDIRQDFMVTVSQCRECGEFMCDRCCAKRSFWRGQKCPKCGSYATTTVGRFSIGGFGGNRL